MDKRRVITRFNFVKEFLSLMKRSYIFRVLDTEKLGTTITKYLQVDCPIPNMERYYAASYSGIVLLLKAEKTADKYVF